MRNCWRVMVLVAVMLGVSTLSGCTPILYKHPPAAYISHVMGYDELQQEYKARGGKLNAVYGFAVVPKNGHDFSKGPCEYWIWSERVGTSTENHEKHHCQVGLFHE